MVEDTRPARPRIAAGAAVHHDGPSIAAAEWTRRARPGVPAANGRHRAQQGITSVVDCQRGVHQNAWPQGDAHARSLIARRSGAQDAEAKVWRGKDHMLGNTSGSPAIGNGGWLTSIMMA